MRLLRGLVRLCAGLGCLTLLASYLGAVHPVGDSLAVFRDLIAFALAAVAVLALVLRVWRVGSVALVASIAAIVHIASFNQLHTPAGPAEPDLIVYAKNLGGGRVDWNDLADDIAATAADVVLLQEVVRPIVDELPARLPDHPHQHSCSFRGSGRIALASRWPLSEPGCTPNRSLAYAVTDAPSGPIWLGSVHQVWPFPYAQADLLPDILEIVAPVGARQVIAGDFNMVPWGQSVLSIAEASETERIGPVLPTIEVRGLGLPIDHVLTDGSGTAIRRPRIGSDHFGMVARIAWD